LREDEDVQKPIELLADVLVRFLDARQRGQQDEFIREFEMQCGEEGHSAEFWVRQLQGKPLSEVFFSLIFPFWNNYDRDVYECERCGRLWLPLGKPRNRRWVSYLPESDERHVLWSQHNHNPYGYLDE
ncbi:MAG TPA: hypothetical protein VJN88_08510, partial [Ktedonobacterales bacterium]|nr:hypothetical protein [Ktedonobacterales bacterium]